MQTASPAAPVTLTMREAAVRLGLSLSTIRRLVATGELHAVRVGVRVLVRSEDLDALLRRDRVTTGARRQIAA